MNYSPFLDNGKIMAVDYGGKIGKAGRILKNLNSSKSAKSNAAKVLNQHKMI